MFTCATPRHGVSQHPNRSEYTISDWSLAGACKKGNPIERSPSLPFCIMDAFALLRAASAQSYAHEHPVLAEFLTSGISVSCANILTLPMGEAALRLRVGANSLYAGGCIGFDNLFTCRCHESSHATAEVSVWAWQVSWSGMAQPYALHGDFVEVAVHSLGQTLFHEMLVMHAVFSHHADVRFPAMTPVFTCRSAPLQQCCRMKGSQLSTAASLLQWLGA